MDITEAINKSLFFTGAGFSFEAKCKTSKAMLIDLNKRIFDSEDETFSEIEKKTINFLLSCLEYHSKWRSLEVKNKQKFIPNIEELALLVRRIKNRENVLPYPITGNWADKLVQLEAEYEKRNSHKSGGKNLFESIEQKLKEECLPSWLEIEKEDHLEPLKDFLKNNPDKDFILKIFTLNNDLLLEKSFRDEVPPFTGYHSNADKKYKKWIGFENKPDAGSGISDRIELFKLHGSLNWFRGNDEKPYELVEFESISSFAEVDSQEEYELEAAYYPFIIFGHGVKFFSVEPFFSLVKAFHEHLRERKYYFVIGYSFFDPYINNLFFEEIQRDPNEGKKLVIITPSLADNYLPVPEEEGFTEEHGFRVLEEKFNKQFVEFFKDVQNNNFYSDLPEFNIKSISDKAIYHIRVKTGEFLEKIFANEGEEFIKMIERFEKDEFDEF